nr:hypothetical protein [Tanacetum cinerariifolium]
MDQNIDFSGSDQIQTPQYHEIHPPSQEISDEVFQAKGDLMKSIQTFLEEFNYIPFEEKPQILLQAWYKFFTIQYAQPEDSKELFHKLLKDLQIINKELKCNHPTFFDDNEDHSVQYKENLENSFNEIAFLNSNQEKEGPPQDSYICQLIREECCIEVSSLLDSEIVSIEEENGVEEENVVQQEEKEVDFEDISQIQDVVLREKLLSITRLISNIESLNNNPTPDRTRSGNTTHANYSLPEYDSFCFEIEPDQERLINLAENDVPDNSSNDPILEEVDLFLSDDSIPPGIENVADDPEGDICFLEELLINDSILSHESSDSNFEDNLSNLRPPLEPSDDNFDLEPEVISAVMEDIDEPDEHFDIGGEIFVSTKIEDFDYFPFMFVIRIFLPYLILPEISPLLLSVKSEDTIFDP